ncbi:MAG TPA: acyltransferase [Bryobacteraceae bacterium]|nr:acyltransferase [Bryobacteraceae bacterium]
MKWKRLEGVDLLRGLAIFFVLMLHVNIRLRLAQVPYTAGIPDFIVQALVWNGQQGVQIFFAVSGFLITAMSLRRWNELSNIDVPGFYRLRLARIAPLFLLLLTVLTALHYAGLKDFVVNPRRATIGEALWSALTFHVNVQESRHGYLPGNWDVLWSLSIEEVFYLFFPLICRVFGRSNMLIVVLVGFVIAGPFARSAATGTWREYSYLGGMEAIAMGCLTAIALSRGWLRGTRLLGIAGALVMVFGLCFGRQMAKWGIERAGLDMTILAFGTCLVIAATAQSGWRSPRLLRPLVSLGQRSYEVYLTHMFVVFAFFDLFLRAGKPMVWVAPLFAAATAAAGLLGTLVARVYSDPLNLRLRAGVAA